MITRRGFIGTLLAGVGAVLAWPVKKVRPWWLKVDGDDTPLVEGTLGPDRVKPVHVAELMDAGDGLPMDLTRSSVTITRFDPKTMKIIGSVHRPLNHRLDDPTRGMVALDGLKEGEGVEVSIITHGDRKITSVTVLNPEGVGGVH